MVGFFCRGACTTAGKENGNTLKGGFFMAELNVTGLAVAKLKEYMQANNIDSALRVALMQGG
jgi:hypothetical protein